MFTLKDFPSDKNSPHDWTGDDWIGYDNIIMKSIQSYIKNNCKLLVPELTRGGWLKQFEQSYSLLHVTLLKNTLSRGFRPKRALYLIKFLTNSTKAFVLRT